MGSKNTAVGPLGKDERGGVRRSIATHSARISIGQLPGRHRSPPDPEPSRGVIAAEESESLRFRVQWPSMLIRVSGIPTPRCRARSEGPATASWIGVFRGQRS